MEREQHVFTNLDLWPSTRTHAQGGAHTLGCANMSELQHRCHQGIHCGRQALMRSYPPTYQADPADHQLP